MMMHAETFSAETETVDVTIRNERRTLRAMRLGDGRIAAFGIAVRYRTGNKIWSGTLWLETNGRESVSGGLDNRARAKIATVVGFYEDHKDTARASLR